MAQLYFHCTSPQQVMVDRRGSELEDLAEAHSEAMALVQRLIATQGPEDWRAWNLLVLDDHDDEVFQLSFASVIGKPH